MIARPLSVVDVSVYIACATGRIASVDTDDVRLLESNFTYLRLVESNLRLELGNYMTCAGNSR